MKEVISKQAIFSQKNKMCLIDLCFYDNKAYMKHIDKEVDENVIGFISKNKKKLENVYNTIKIEFFRKLEYEKILDDYLSKKQVSQIAVNDNKTKNVKIKQEKKQKKEKDKNKKEKVNMAIDIVEYVSRNIEKIQWNKKVEKRKSIFYCSVEDKEIELKAIKSNKGHVNYVMMIDNNLVSVKEQMIMDMIKTIKKNNPQFASSVYKVTHNPESKYYNPDSPEEQARLRKLKDQEAKAKKRMLAEEKRREEKQRILEEKRKQLEEKQKQLEKQKANKIEEKQKTITKMDNDRKEQKKTEDSLPRIGYKDFVVRRSVFKCMHSKHKIRNLVAAVSVMDKDDHENLIRVSAGYCENCKIYFIMDSTYISLKSKGIIMCRVSDEKNYMKNYNVAGMTLASESILMQYGYTVNQIDGLGPKRRQKILAIIIDKGILSKSEVISYLDFFISQRQTRSNQQIAISKWEDDREFVEEYKVGEYTKFGVKGIIRR